MHHTFLFWFSVGCLQLNDACYYVINSKTFYNGTTSITKSGKNCQNWDSNRPHIPNYRAHGQMNYCRNPDNDTKLWCYTTDPLTRWEYCDIQQCDDCYYVINSKIFYNGTTSITKSGKNCQNWESNRPHIPNYRAHGQMNYCRNPDNDTKLWCYTTDPDTRWEYCDIQQCDMQIVLVNGDAPNKGRVEIIRNGVRGTVCDDEWDDNDATVICRMLGYNKGGTAVAETIFGAGSGDILLDDVQCDGTESSIENCRHAGWTVNNCAHWEDAGVQCRLEYQTSLWTSTYSPVVHIVLVNGSARTTGRVEIIRNGVRGTVCDDEWDDNDATVICRMLGYNKGGIAVAGVIYSEGSGNILLDDVQCDGTESSIAECRHAGWRVHNCQHSEDAAVKCWLDSQISLWTSTFSPDIQIELLNGGAPERGRVEIIRNGVRGTVCDDRWDDNDATVICRMLGFYKGGKAVAGGIYGEGSGHILLDDVQCDGTENFLHNCRHAGWLVHNCQHSQDAGVRCRLKSQISLWASTFSPGCGFRPLQKGNRVKIAPPVRSNIDSVYYIIAGKYTEYGIYPWQVGVRNISIYRSKITQHWCGGTILNTQWVLSAAHCFEGIEKSKITLRTGDHDNTQTDRYEQEFDVEAIYMHENFNPDTLDYDVALLKISSDVGIRFNDYVQPACLPDKDTPYKAGQPCHISGWGAHKDEDDDDDEDEGDESVLKEAMIRIINDTTCQRLYNGSITSRMFCAGFEKGGKDSCSGDSGGPLVCKIDGRYTVLGAVSWGGGCGKPGYPGVYTHIRNLLPWIIDKLKKYN